MANPSIQQYQEALQHPARAFTDPDLANGKIAVSGLGVPRVLCGGFALTYAVETKGKKYAVRCFHREAKGLEKRYEAISKKLKSIASPYFVDFEYQPKGIQLAGSAFPVVKMAWAAGETLGEFLEANHRNAAKVKNLLTSLTQLATSLEQIGIAHGDIQDLNLMVSDDGRRIQLIDYDGMYVPELASMGGSELGHRDYQHPQRDEKKYDANLDRFSFIALSLALRALCEKSSLWQSSQSGAGVIVFRANDYADPASSAILSEIATLPSLTRDAKNFASICAASFASVPALAQFIAGTNIPSGSINVRPRSVVEVGAIPSGGYISAYPVLNATDFAAFERNIGQMVELVGRVVEVKVDRTRGGKPYVFINFGHWRGKTVKINLWSETLLKGGEQPTEKMVGRWLTIRGLVEPVYASKKYSYQHISITADAIGQISYLTEAEAQYRLKVPRPQMARTVNTNNNNSAALDRLRGSTSTGSPNGGSGQQTVNSRSSPNQAILQQLRESTPSTPLQRSGGAASLRRPSTPSPSSQRQYPTGPQQPTGFWSWLANIFK